MTQRIPGEGSAGRIPPGLMLALGYVSMAASLSTDMYPPAFPGIAEHFSVGPSAVQLTLTAFMAGAAMGQLLIGSLSDALGRRRSLIAGLAVFAACAILAVLSPTLEFLITVRALQGFAGASGAVLARAVIADLAAPRETVRAYSLLFVMIALGPAIASPLGALLTEFGGWRATLTGLAVLGSGMFLVAALRIPESLPAEARSPFSASSLTLGARSLLGRMSYLGHAVAFAAGYGVLIVYIASSSFIVQSMFGLGPVGYALTFTFSSAAVMLGSWLSGQASMRWSSVAVLRIGQLLALGASGLLLISALVGALSFSLYLLLIGCFALGAGFVMSTASALAIGQAAGIAGTGSALIGFGQFVTGAMAAPLGGLAGEGTAVPAAAGMTAFALIGLLGGLAGAAALRRTTRSG